MEKLSEHRDKKQQNEMKEKTNLKSLKMVRIYEIPSRMCLINLCMLGTDNNSSRQKTFEMTALWNQTGTVPTLC